MQMIYYRHTGLQYPVTYTYFKFIHIYIFQVHYNTYVHTLQWSIERAWDMIFSINNDVIFFCFVQ